MEFLNYFFKFSNFPFIRFQDGATTIGGQVGRRQKRHSVLKCCQNPMASSGAKEIL